MDTKSDAPAAGSLGSAGSGLSAKGEASIQGVGGGQQPAMRAGDTSALEPRERDDIRTGRDDLSPRGIAEIQGVRERPAADKAEQTPSRLDIAASELSKGSAVLDDSTEALLAEVEWLRQEQAAELKADLERFDNRPVPPYYQINETDSTPQPIEPHLVPATTIDKLDTFLDERRAEEHQGKPVADLPDANLRGVVYEAMSEHYLEDTLGPDSIGVHPKGMKLKDGASIEPDFDYTSEKGSKQLYDAKAYTRKEVHFPDAAASSLTHMHNLEKASRYTQVDDPAVESVTFLMPRETADLPAVQEAVANLETPDRPVLVERVGDEAGIKQRMSDLRSDTDQRYAISDDVWAEVERVQNLPVEERREAWGSFVNSLQDVKGDETTAGRNLRGDARIERGGEGVTIFDKDGKEHTIWFADRKTT